MADFTPTQGRYLAFIHAYTTSYGCPPAETDIARALLVSPPSVNQMVKVLEKKGLILRHPGQARAIQILIPEAEIPSWNARKTKTPAAPSAKPPVRVAADPATPPTNLYVLSIFLMGGPVNEAFANKVISRAIEIRGDQTLEQLHKAIFQAYDRQDDQRYEFQFGKRPYDPDGPNYQGPPPKTRKKGIGDASQTKLDDLNLKLNRVFGYRFDFRHEWFHEVQIDRIEKAIPTVTYPRLIKRVGKSPPQYDHEPKR